METTDARALLDIFNRSFFSRWNYPEVVGEWIDSGAGIGHGVNLSFKFLTSLPSHSAIGGFQKFSAAQVAAATDVLASIEAIADIDFTQTSGTGQVTFGNGYLSAGLAGFAYLPNYSYRYIGNEVISVTEDKSAGDIWIKRIEFWDSDAWQPGGDGYQTLLHEVGHALGLKHPFESDYRLPAAYDNERFTVMSYTQASGMVLLEVFGNSSSYSWQSSYLRPSTLMPMDIDALQYLYGPNTNARAGNTTYAWDWNEELLQTIWDGGGRDTIDCANQVFSCVINLEGNSFSSIGWRQTAGEIKAGLGLPDWFPASSLPQDIYNGSNNLAIARNVVIENARGGSGWDRITGNGAANHLAGNGGNDMLAGAAGNDTLHGGTGADTMAGGSGNDSYYVDSIGDVVSEAGAGGTDRVFSSVAAYTLGGNVEHGRIMSTGTASMAGNALSNEIQAGTGSNVLSGGGGTDTVSYEFGAKAKGVIVSLATTAVQATGGSGSDRLSGFENLTGSDFGDKLAGNAGNNRLNGGGGRDTLTGGGGKDIFDFDALADTGTTSTTRDMVMDFVRGQDDIDLSGLDAKAGSAANDAFSFIGKAAFSAAGQLRYVYDGARGYGILYGNTDADAAAEFTLQVMGVGSLSASDFIA